MRYPKMPDVKHEAELLHLYAQLKHEYGAKGIQRLLERAHREIRATVAALRQLPDDPAVAKRQPNDLKEIQTLRSQGPRKLWQSFDAKVYADRLQGALLGRMAGCTLGVPVEFWDIQPMENLARENNMAFPPQNYWPRVPNPYSVQYNVSPREAYSLAKMDGVPVDDDIAYTLLGLLVVEEYGPDFTRVIGETVAMGMDNDCTTATAGSLVGAVVGKAGIPQQWTAQFHNKVHSYLNNKPLFRIDDLLKRFTRQAGRVWEA